MKLLAVFVVALLSLTDPTLISKINGLKADAKKAYLKNDYKAAIKTYRYLIDSLNVREDEIFLNLASAYYNLKDTANALSQYQSVTQSSNNQLRSKAQQQLGIIADQQGKQDEALNHFKEAIKSDLTNKDARYNYELLKKKVEEKKKKNQQDKNNSNDKKPEPTEFAKRIKAQADQLAAQYKFADALRVLQNGAKQDNTVEPNYKDMMDRLGEVVEINGGR